MLLEIVVVLLEDVRSDKQVEMNSTEEIYFKAIEFVCRNTTDFRVKSIRVVHIIEEFGSNHKTIVLKGISYAKSRKDVRCKDNTIGTVFVNHKLVLLNQSVDIDK